MEPAWPVRTRLRIICTLGTRSQCLPEAHFASLGHTPASPGYHNAGTTTSPLLCASQCTSSAPTRACCPLAETRRGAPGVISHVGIGVGEGAGGVYRFATSWKVATCRKTEGHSRSSRTAISVTSSGETSENLPRLAKNRRIRGLSRGGASVLDSKLFLFFSGPLLLMTASRPDLLCFSSLSNLTNAQRRRARVICECSDLSQNR